MRMARTEVSAANTIDSGAAFSSTKFAEHKFIPSTSNGSPHYFENIEKQEDSDDEASASALDYEEENFDEESWGFVLLEAILYIPMLVQSLFASMNFARSFHAPWWLQRIQSVVFKIDSNIWPPPSLLLLVALTIIALVVHPDGFTWVILGKTRNGVLSFAEVCNMWWDIVINEHGAIISSILALTTFAGLFCLAYVLRKTLSPRKPFESSDKNNTSAAGKLQQKKKKRKGGSSRVNHRLGKNKSSSESHGDVDRCTHDEPGLGSLLINSSSPTLQHPPLERIQDTGSTKISDDNLPVYSSNRSQKSQLRGNNAVHQRVSPVSDVPVTRQRTLSDLVPEPCGPSAFDSRNTYPLSGGATQPTKSEGLQRDVDLSMKGGSRTHHSTHSNNQQVGKKKNARRGAARKLNTNHSYSKQTNDLSNLQASTESQSRSAKHSNAVASRTVERHEGQDSTGFASRNFPASKSRKSNRSFAISSSHNEIKVSLQIMTPSTEHADLNVRSSEYLRPSFNEIQSSSIVLPRPAFPYQYHQAAPAGYSSSLFRQAYQVPDSTKQGVAVNSTDGSWERRGAYLAPSSSLARTIPPPPGLGLPVGLKPNFESELPRPGASSVASIGGSPLPMVSSVQSNPFTASPQESKSHDISMGPRLVKENPFETSSSALHSAAGVVDQNEEDRIDAELQELGGRMVGSILDF